MDTIKGIVVYVKGSSQALFSKAMYDSKRNQTSAIKLKQDVPTRWNTNFDVHIWIHKDVVVSNIACGLTHSRKSNCSFAIFNCHNWNEHLK